MGMSLIEVETGTRHPVPDAGGSVGSDPDDTVRLTEAGLRPRQAQLHQEGAAWVLSSAGADLQVDGRLLSRLHLQHGQEFELSGRRLRAYIDEAVIARSAGADPGEEPEALLEHLRERIARVRSEAGRIIVGQEQVLEQLLTALLAEGHVVLVGVPGLAKTLLVRVLAGVLDCRFGRVQFTPDLMPADIIGTDILHETSDGERRFRFRPGPVFTNILLADEINRTPPKTQSALLEAMQEHGVSSGGMTHALPRPFLVVATQNPIEQEGTYPLPEAQLDRFMFAIRMGYPSAAEEERILTSTTGDLDWRVERLLDTSEILRLQRFIRQIPLSDHVVAYVAALIRASRPEDPSAPEFVRDWVRWGAGPRAGQNLVLAAKAHAAMQGRFSVGVEDVRRFALPVLRHRIFTTFVAASDGVTTDAIVKRLLNVVDEPRYGARPAAVGR